MSKWLGIAVLFCWAKAAAADAPVYIATRRSEHIVAILQALRATDQQSRSNMQNYINVIAQNSCRGESSSLRASCLIEAARKNCRQIRNPDGRQRCDLISDVVISNQLSEPAFINNRTRYEIMNKSKDVRGAILAELRRRYATLVTEYRMSLDLLAQSDKDSELAPRIDAYCMENADRHGLSWQHCVSAVVWFIGTAS